MPIYSFHCPTHGAFDLLLPMSEWNRETAGCLTCGAPSERQAELCAIQPDDKWHFGEFAPGIGEVNSRSKLAKIKRQRNIVTLDGRNDAEAMKKTAAEARAQWDVQLEKQTHDYFSEALAGQGLIDSFGEATLDATRPQGNGDLKGEFKAEKLAA
jgi:putative FmdB family regulatory protein